MVESEAVSTATNGKDDDVTQEDDEDKDMAGWGDAWSDDEQDGIHAPPPIDGKPEAGSSRILQRSQVSRGHLSEMLSFRYDSG